ncbi:hypothetical protein LCGC14_2176890, partial [marine sediment metagenome]
ILFIIFGSFKKTGPAWFEDAEGGGDKLAISFRPTGLLVGILFLVASIGVALATGQVPAGERGVVLKFGAVTDKTLGEGIYLVAPFVNSVERMSVQTVKQEEPASAASKDLQTVQTTVALNFHLNPERVNDVYQTLRRDYVSRIIQPAIQESVKAVTATFDAEELITKRPQVKSEIEEVLSSRLAINGISLDTLSLTNFEFSGAFAASIEAKQVAAQDAIRAENLLIQIRVEAEQNEAQAAGDKLAAIERAEGTKQSNILNSEGLKESAILEAEGQAQARVIRANAEAEARVIQAIAEAKAILEVADATADGNALLDATLSKQVIDFSLVENLAPSIRTVVIPSGQDLILSDALLGSNP